MEQLDEVLGRESCLLDDPVKGATFEVTAVIRDADHE
jgi:hypothetical protein